MQANLYETSGVVLQKNAPVNRAVQWMADIVHDKAISIAPAVHVVVGKRNAVIVPERLVGDQIAEARVGSGTPGVLEDYQFQRLNQSRFPL